MCIGHWLSAATALRLSSFTPQQRWRACTADAAQHSSHAHQPAIMAATPVSPPPSAACIMAPTALARRAPAARLAASRQQASLLHSSAHSARATGALCAMLTSDCQLTPQVLRDSAGSSMGMSAGSSSGGGACRAGPHAPLAQALWRTALWQPCCRSCYGCC